MHMIPGARYISLFVGIVHTYTLLLLLNSSRGAICKTTPRVVRVPGSCPPQRREGLQEGEDR